MDKTKIDWADSTWNPVTGCLHGCEYCYARKIAERFKGTDSEVFDEAYRVLAKHELDKSLMLNEKKAPYPYGFAPTFHRYRLAEYTVKAKPRNVFVCSMADLFGDWVPHEWVEEVFDACEKGPQHNYLFLTKNPVRYAILYAHGDLPQKENMWYGTTVTSPDDPAFFSDRHKTFLSIEPILKPFGKCGWEKEQLPDWVIIGAETGGRKDKVIPQKGWIKEILEDCHSRRIPVFMKSNLSDIWKDPLVQELPEQLKRRGGKR